MEDFLIKIIRIFTGLNCKIKGVLFQEPRLNPEQFRRPVLNFANGARNENRTHTGYPIRPSNVRVYQFRHSRVLN